MTITESIRVIRKSGFTLEIVKGRIAVSPIDRLTDRQLDWLRRHKEEVLRALNAERVQVSKLREVVRFELKNEGGGGSCLGIPGESQETIIQGLKHRYGDRLAEVSGGHIRWRQPHE